MLPAKMHIQAFKTRSENRYFSHLSLIQLSLKNGPRYNFTFDEPNEKKMYRKRNDCKNTKNLSEHVIFIPSTHLWAMGNFYFSNGNL
jgi:hypothetical protein